MNDGIPEARGATRRARIANLVTDYVVGVVIGVLAWAGFGATLGAPIDWGAAFFWGLYLSAILRAYEYAALPLLRRWFTLV